MAFLQAAKQTLNQGIECLLFVFRGNDCTVDIAIRSQIKSGTQIFLLQPIPRRKVEIQAQGDGADLIARKGIQIISTEEQIEIKANKKIVLTAGGSQIEISGAGVLPTTAGKFEVKAGQHQFLGVRVSS